MDPRTVEDVIMDFKGRRAAILKALTKDVQEFYRLCDPSYPNLCLYGYPNHRWEVNLPPPSDLPEPRLGINFSRDAMKREEWLSMVALHSDAWLHAIASYFAAKFRFDKADRRRLFSKISDFPPISELMSREARSRRRAKIEDCGLPEEMLIEVLSRVPVKDLIRYRCVSKLWRSLIDEPDFVSTHLKNYRGNLEGTHLLVMEFPRSYMKDEQVLVRRSDTFRKVMSLDFLDGHRDSCLLSYINGVMLVRNGDSKWFHEILLWNPSINRSITLPNSVFQAMRDASYFELGLGFDASHNDYKVVAIVYPQAGMAYPFGRKRHQGVIPGLVQVYSLSTNSWSSLIGVEPPTYWSYGDQAFVNGAIHWTNLGPDVRDDVSWKTVRDSHVVSFDVANEVFTYFELPQGINDSDEYIIKSSLTVLHGSLAMFCSYVSHSGIWVMNEYGVPGSWCKLYKFTLGIENLLYLKSNGELLYAIEGKGVLAYDVKKESVRNVAKTYCRTSKYVIHTYVESLVLLHKQELDNLLDLRL